MSVPISSQFCASGGAWLSLRAEFEVTVRDARAAGRRRGVDPVLAAGGIMDGRGIAAALALGAQGVQLGTAFLRCDEAGTTAEHRDALAHDTTIANVMTGRHARGVHRPLIDRLEASGLEPPDYPLLRLVFPEQLMFTGQGAPLARSLPAGELVAALAAETEAALATAR